MNRRSPKYGKGVIQRCDATCPPQGKTCKTHTWAYYVELPNGPNGKRRQWTKGGFASAKEAADARAEILAADHVGMLPTDGKQLVRDWLIGWLGGKAGAESIRPTTEVGYRGHVENYLIPHLGHLRLIDLKPQHVTNMLIAIRKDHDERIAKAKAANGAGGKSTGTSTVQRRDRPPAPGDPA